MTSRLISIFILILGLAAGAAGGTVTGVVRNGTKGTPAAGADVVLLSLQGGMDTVANTKTDAQGRFRLENAAIGQQAMLIRVVYRGVNFHQALPPGRDTADVEVFDPTADPKAIQITQRVVVFQTRGNSLVVGEQYTISNDVKPPEAYFKADGNFVFELPEGAELGQVSAWGSSGMPTVQGTLDKGKNRYAIAFPFRPGESGVRFAYEVAYPGNKAELKIPSPYAAAQVALLVPPQMRMASSGFVAGGTEQGMNVFTRDAVAASAPLNVSISGTAPEAPAAAQGGQQDAGGGRDANLPVQAMPSRLDNLKWILLGGLAALFAMSALFLWRKPAPAIAGAAGAATLPKSAGKENKPAKQATRATPPRDAEHAVDEVNRQVGQSLDELKDTLFRLELRRQAGTISEEEYARERSRAEKILRDLVRG